jgi:hypothetical protein
MAATAQPTPDARHRWMVARVCVSFFILDKNND